VNDAAVLLSGGMDSAALAYWLHPAFAITVDYGQAAAAAELRASAALCAEIGLRHEVIRADCSAVGAGDMAPTATDLPAGFEPPGPDWWPFRNQLLVTLGAGRAVRLGVRRLLLGTVRTDARFADGRPEFFARLNDLLAVQEGGLSVVAPASAMTSAELVARSGIPPDVLAWSHSCHKSENACGRCRGCVKRSEVWQAVCGEAVDGDGPAASER
jgi:7-cyano-7-deazaguanine synthase